MHALTPSPAKGIGEGRFLGDFHQYWTYEKHAESAPENSIFSPILGLALDMVVDIRRLKKHKVTRCVSPKVITDVIF